jgi:hypothetical protein
VRAAAETIYDELINDKFFIEILNNIEKILGFVDQIIDKVGGLKGVLNVIGVIITTTMKDSLAKGLSNLAYNIKMMTPGGVKQVQEERANFIKNSVGVIPQNTDYSTHEEVAQQNSLHSQLTL